MKLHATIEKILYPKIDNWTQETWAILKTSIGIAKGKTFYSPQENEKVIFEGKWSIYKGSKEFQFSSMTSDIPTDSYNLLRYTASLTSGLGEARTEVIWEILGEDWPKIQEGDIKGISTKVLENFRNAMLNVKREQKKSKIVTYLLQIGCTMNMANAAFNEWEDQTIGIVQKDCYKLAYLPNYSFLDVDKRIRHSFNIEDDDPRRIKAAIIYAIRQIANGSTVVTWDLLKQAVLKYTKVSPSIAANQTKDLFKVGELVAFKKSRKIALKSDYDAEQAIWRFING